MLEPDIKAVYQRMAAVEPPPSRISIPDAGRRGRARLRIHRASIIGSPLFAAGAVLTIALSGVLPAGLFGTRHAAGPSAASAAAPEHFNPLRPYAAFGWLPTGSPKAATGLFGRTDLLLDVKHLAIVLDVYAAGRCVAGPHTLKCAAGQGQPQQIPDGQIGPRVGEVDGHPAYWWPASSRQSTSALGRSYAHLAPFSGSAGSLKWQYAGGGWAILDASSLHTALRIARNVRFGPTAGPPISFAFQLTGVPASWQVNSVGTSWLGGVQYASTFVVTAGPVDGVPLGVYPEATPLFDAGAGSNNACAGLMYYKTSTRVINGYKVLTDSSKKYWPESQLCASNANGVFAWINMGSHPAISAADLFAHHMRLLGPNPADWTTKPIN